MRKPVDYKAIKANFTDKAEKSFIKKLGTHRLKGKETIDPERLKYKKFDLLIKYLDNMKNRAYPKDWNVPAIRRFAEKELTKVRVG